MSPSGNESIPRCFAAVGCEVGEGPFWWDGALWWVDVNHGVLHRCERAGGEVKTWSLGDRTGAVVPVAGARDTFLAAQQGGIVRFRLEGSRVAERRHLGDPEAHLPDNRFNDGKCDARGRFWAGTMSRSRVPGAGALYCLDEAGRITKRLADVSLSNGLGWSPDARRFYHVDSPTRRVDVFDFDLAGGVISNRRSLCECPPEWGVPDGMTVDAEGALWVAFWDGGAVRRIDPANGRLLRELRLPCSRVTSCCFGGPDGRTLFITTARGIDDACAGQREAGHVFICDPGVSGPGTETCRAVV